MAASGFLEAVLRDAGAARLGPALDDNVDPERFPRGMAPVTEAEQERRAVQLRRNASDWDWLAGQFDAEDTLLLGARLRFHLLGHTHARIGPAAAAVRELLDVADRRLIVERDVTPVPFAGHPATHRFTLDTLGHAIEVESYTLGVQGTYQLGQYWSLTHPEARPRPGDVAVDAGGCFGETALWLADVVGPDGHVRVLEFSPGNLTILRRNLARNPRLNGRISLSEAALWHTGGEALSFGLDGPASTVVVDPSGPAGGVAPVRSVALDDLVANGELGRVDFIKMDIEGAEPSALTGAERALRRFTPRLALAAYHDVDHLWQLPRALAELGLGYRFGLGHFTMHDEETVIYAWVPGR
jgi:FkbM family methyltransferase